MNTEPKVKRYLDAEEKELDDAIKQEGFKPGKNTLTPKRLQKLQEAARATINEERTRISLRVPKSDLARLKARALREGVPYQTLINSILHQAANDT